MITYNRFIYRFKVCIICADETGVLPIIFPDDEIQSITGKDVYEVENDNRELEYQFYILVKVCSYSMRP